MSKIEDNDYAALQAHLELCRDKKYTWANVTADQLASFLAKAREADELRADVQKFSDDLDAEGERLAKAEATIANLRGLLQEARGYIPGEVSDDLSHRIAEALQ